MSYCYLIPTLEVLLWRIAINITRAILPDGLLTSHLVLLEICNLFRIHMLCHLICLPFLKREAKSLMTVVLVVGLILVILNTNKPSFLTPRLERKTNKSIDRCSLRDDLECPTLSGKY